MTIKLRSVKGEKGLLQRKQTMYEQRRPENLSGLCSLYWKWQTASFIPRKLKP